MHAAADYDFAAYDTLPSFADAQQSLQAHRLSLNELGGIIVKHNLEKHIGVSLLHKHFRLPFGRSMVRILKGDEIISTSQQFNSALIPWSWRLFSLRERYAFVPTEYLHPDSFSTEARRQSSELQHNTAFLSEFARSLQKLGVEHIFGLSTKNILTELDVQASIQIVAEVPSTVDSNTSRFLVQERPPLGEPEGAAFWSFTRPANGPLQVVADYTCSACNSPSSSSGP